MTARGPWQGMWTIARLNWPFYVAAVAALLACAAAVMLLTSVPLRLLAALGFVGALYFMVGSLGVSHVVYDRSDLYRWGWLARALRDLQPGKVVCCHAGFDECSEALRAQLGVAHWIVLDHFDAARMTEPSIRRARRLYPPVDGTLPAAYDRWPEEAAGADVVFALLAIHELRSDAERIAWFREARRCLRQGGLTVVVEHTRDVANFLAFGPGFLHFHSPATWRHCGQAAGLRLVDEFRVTPWVRVFSMERS